MNAELSNHASEIRREYYKKWRKNNKQRVKQYNAQFWERKALELKLQNKSDRSNKYE